MLCLLLAAGSLSVDLRRPFTIVLVGRGLVAAGAFARSTAVEAIVEARGLTAALGGGSRMTLLMPVGRKNMPWPGSQSK